MNLVPFTSDWQRWFCDLLDSPEEKEFCKCPHHVLGYQVMQEFLIKQEQGVAVLLGAKKDGQKVGYVFFDKIDCFNRHCTAHIALDPELRGKQALLPLIKEIKKYAFEHLAMDLLYGETPIDRFPLVWPAMKAEGFEKVGIMPNFIRYNGKYIDVVFTALKRRD